MADSGVLRILDANFNRLAEGLRVLEEVERLLKNNPDTARSIKNLRHDTARCRAYFSEAELLRARDSQGDVGREGSAGLENERPDLRAVVSANFKRCEEAARVLEEFAKLANADAVPGLKALRFALYSLEKSF